MKEENERRKAEADDEQRLLKLELTKGSSRTSGSVAHKIEGVGSRRNQERTTRLGKKVAQHSAPSRPLFPDCVLDLPTNVAQDIVDKLFTVYPKTKPLFQPGLGLFSAPLTELSILKKPEIHKSIRITDPQAPLTKTTFQQQGTSTF